MVGRGDRGCARRPAGARWIALAASLLAGCSEPAPGEACEDDPCGCEGIADVAAPGLPEPEVAFEVWHEGTVVRHAWSRADGDTIRCTRHDCLQDAVTLTFAGGPAEQPRLELQVCGLADRSLFSPLELPAFPECEPMQRGFVARWSDGSDGSDGSVWQSTPGVEPCRLAVTVRDAALTGTFECAGLRSTAGDEVRLSTGSFECTVGPAP